MKFPREKVIEAVNCCAEFYCGECPYNIYEDPSDRLSLRCIRMLMEDIKKIFDNDYHKSYIKTQDTQEEWEKFWRNL